jgi:hypothetical protein
MIRARGAILVLIFLVLLGTVVQIVAGAAATQRRIAAGRQAPVTAPPARVPSARPARQVVQSLDAVQDAFGAGDVHRLCRPGALVDPAVIRQQNAQGGCESELEGLVASKGQLRFSVQSVAMRHDLATADVATASGGRIPLDFIRQGARWVLSFTDGVDPMPALAGVW